MLLKVILRFSTWKLGHGLFESLLKSCHLGKFKHVGTNTVVRFMSCHICWELNLILHILIFVNTEISFLLFQKDCFKVYVML